MPQLHPAALTISHRVLRALRALNFFYGAFIGSMLLLSITMPERLFPMLGVSLEGTTAAMIRGMRLIMIAGLVTIPMNHTILERLLDIVGTVREGDPFIAANARRLSLIAWLVLALEVIHIVIGILAANAGSPTQPLDINWSFSFTPWLAVLLLFVLARVFEHGARMRSDLEGTV